MMRRRDFMTLACAGSLSTMCTRRANAVPRKGRPNLLIIHTDEHHFNTLGCYGGSVVNTPHIDWLAANGAHCTSFYATTPVCSPSRAAFVSGRYPQNTPVTTNNIRLDGSTVTFASALKSEGYATGYAGKWHLDGTGKPQWEPRRKFGFEDNRYMFNRGHWKKMKETAEGPAVAARDKKGKPSYAVDGADETSFTTDWLTTRTIDFIKAHHSEPLCYMVSIPDPHGPNTVRAPYDTMYTAKQVQIPPTLKRAPGQTPKWGASAKGVTEASLRKIMPAYYGMVKCIDDNVGRILQTLRELDLMDNTIVIFTADHGDLCGEHGRLNKGVPYEGSAKIPFVMYYPRSVKAATVVDQALSCVDFMPTVLSVMGVPSPRTVQGRDASALFTSGAPADWEDIAFIRGTHNWLCAVTHRYKLVYSKQDSPWMFDLEKDPNELNNVFGEPAYKETAAALTRQLMAYCKKYADPYGSEPKTRAEMQAACET